MYHNNQIECKNCGEIFIFRQVDADYYNQRGIPELHHCPICRKRFRNQKEKERQEAEAISRRVKKEEELREFEANLKEWNVIPVSEAEPKTGDSTLYVIGNGFDLMHGARSSYYDFGKTIGKNSILRFYLDNYLEVDDLWADFEGALARINVEMMCAPHIMDSFLDSIGAFDKDAGVAEFYLAAETAAAPIRSFATDLRKRFLKWVLTLRTKTDDRPLKGIIKQNGKYLNFNYTEFVEELYGVGGDRICYIHGCRNKCKGFPSEELVLGHMPGASDNQYDFEDQYTYVPVEHTQMVYDAQQVALGYVSEADEELTKNCDSIIERHRDFFDSLSCINRIITIGHSLYPVDWEYFSEIISIAGKENNLQWFLGCHGKADLDRIIDFVNHFRISKDRVYIFRTDTIRVTIDDNEDENISKKNSEPSRRMIGISDDRRWNVVTGSNFFEIVYSPRNECEFRRIVATQISKAVFNTDGRYLFLVAKGYCGGVFLLQFNGSEWKFLGELEPVPNQKVINMRLKKILINEGNAVFVYNNRLRKYSLSDARLVFNKGIQGAAKQHYEGEDLTKRFLG